MGHPGAMLKLGPSSPPPHTCLFETGKMEGDEDWLTLVDEQESKAKKQVEKKPSDNSTGLESKVG